MEELEKGLKDEQRQVWQKWNTIGGPKYPHDQVVRYCFRNFPPAKRSTAKVLDLGCGSGVHTVFLCAEGFSVTSTDISAIGISNTKEKLKKLNLSAALRVESADIIDFPDDSFDLVVCVGVYDCCGPLTASKSITRVKRVLKENGLGFFMFASNDDARVTGGSDEFPLYGFSEADVHRIFDIGFSKTCIDRLVATYEGGLHKQSDWIITVRN